MKAPAEDNSIKSVLVSVIVPAYNQAQYLREAIKSILDQSYSNYEILIVDDASPDNTSDVAKSFDDPRIKYICHSENRGLSAARNTGILASTGEILAFLDADDMFHPEKLRMHIEFLQIHQDVGLTYNARFELNYSDTTIRELWQPPSLASLRDLVLGFPFTPSDMVVRKVWLSKEGLFDPGVGSAEDTDLPCRLALSGCKFAGIEKALNYRRYHSGRRRKNLRQRLSDISCVLETVFADPRCPEDVLAVRDVAIKEHLMSVMSLALIQEEVELGQELVLELIKIDPSVLEGYPCELLDFIVTESIADEKMNHEILLRRIFSELPKEVSYFSEYFDWAVAQGYLRRGIRAAIWGRLEQGKSYFERARSLNAAVDDKTLRSIAHRLLGYQTNFGSAATHSVLERLTHNLDQFGDHHNGRALRGYYWISLAFRSYERTRFSTVPGAILRALINDPSYLTNRGVISILIRSLRHMKQQNAIGKIS